MLSLCLTRNPEDPLKVLCVGAHSDDIEIGCGGTILRLREEYPHCRFHWAVFSANGVREAEARRAAELFAGEGALHPPLLKDFRDGYMPFAGAEVKDVFEHMKTTVNPDLILTHTRNDAHQDHRLISELTWNTFRDHLILEYEIPKYDSDTGQPEVFIPLSSTLWKAKIQYLMEAFPSQHCRRWFHEDTFASLMRLRGTQCNAPSGYAEAFYCRKAVL